MALMKRMPHEMDWPMWMTRRLGEMPDLLGDLFEGSTMRIEEFETDGHLVIRAEMPGIDPDEDVEITVDDHLLHLRAERRSQTEEEDVTGWRSEFHYGSFERTMPLPTGATEDDVTATYADGILEIRVPVDREADTAKRVPITRAS
jgi:HSP20 family protein